MSSRAKKTKDIIVGQKISTVCQVLTIMQNEADKMSWWQRKKVARQFVRKGNIDCFFQLAQKNKKVKNEKQKDIQNTKQK